MSRWNRSKENDEIRMSNAEGNPNDKIRNGSQRLAQEFVIRASSFLSCLVNCRCLRSNIQKHSRFPIAVLFLDREIVERHGFDVSALMMPRRIQPFAGGFRL